MQNITGKHIALSCIAIAGAAVSCYLHHAGCFIIAAIIVGLNID